MGEALGLLRVMASRELGGVGGSVQRLVSRQNGDGAASEEVISSLLGTSGAVEAKASETEVDTRAEAKLPPLRKDSVPTQQGPSGKVEKFDATDVDMLQRTRLEPIESGGGSAIGGNWDLYQQKLSRETRERLVKEAQQLQSGRKAPPEGSPLVVPKAASKKHVSIREDLSQLQIGMFHVASQNRTSVG